MKIAFLHRDLPPHAFAGVAVQVHRLANALCTLGQEVTVFTESPKPDEALYQIKSVDFPGRRFVSKFLPQLKRVWFPLGCRSLDFSGYDVVHVHGDGGFLRYAPNFVRTFYGSARFEAEHSTSLRGKLAQIFSYALEKREASHCRHSVAIGEHVRRFLPAVKTVTPCMTAHAPNPDALNRKSGHPSIIYLGSQGGRKRGELALAMLPELRQEFPDLVLHYVGPPAEAEELKTVPGLRFHSRLPEAELDRLFAQCWIYAGFSTYEGFGVPWAEALSNGCAVVTTPHLGAQEWLRDGETALIREAAYMNDTLKKLCHDSEQRQAMAQRGFKAADGFSPDRVAKQYLDIYRQAMGRT